MASVAGSAQYLPTAHGCSADELAGQYEPDAQATSVAAAPTPPAQ